MSNLRFIGDVHGHWNRYMDIATDSVQSIQVGDFGVGFMSDHDTKEMDA